MCFMEVFADRALFEERSLICNSNSSAILGIARYEQSSRNYHIPMGGTATSASASHSVDMGSLPKSSHTKDIKNGIYSFPT